MSKARLLHLVVAAVLACGTPLALAMSRDEAAARVRQSTGGRVLAVEQSEQNGRPVYKVKVLTPSGEVRIVVVDAGSSSRR